MWCASLQVAARDTPSGDDSTGLLVAVRSRPSLHEVSRCAFASTSSLTKWEEPKCAAKCTGVQPKALSLILTLASDRGGLQAAQLVS